MIVSKTDREIIQECWKALEPLGGYERGPYVSSMPKTITNLVERVLRYESAISEMRSLLLPDES